MADREFFVICNNCGSEVSPYVTECPYCGTRLRKSAPDLKKQKKVEEREERKAAKKREKLRAQYEGGASGGGEAGSWIQVGTRPVATITLVTISVVLSVLAASGLSDVSPWIYDHLVYTGQSGSDPWKFVTTAFVQGLAGYGFVCLGIFAIFGAGIEKRFGAIAPLAVWIVSCALGVGLESVLAKVGISYGAYAPAVGAVLAWTMVIVRQEDLRDYDTLGLAAVGFVLCALPLATDAARLWPLVGGIIGGLICGAVLSRMSARASF